MKIIVGLSGGVDSSVVALMLKNEGHAVIGVTMKIWRAGKYAGGGRNACFGPDEEKNIATAEAFCSHIGIPFHTFDCSESYESLIIDNFRTEYLKGRTPNPCVRCNAMLKFALLPRLAREAGIVYDAYATGHYARIQTKNGRCQLLRAVDTFKDQSYFLYRLSQEQLNRHRFPLGNLTKSEVRQVAHEHNLTTAEQRDSQDFYSGDQAELIGEPDRPGNIVDRSGKILGTHTGFWKYTIGQRKGIGIAHPLPLYVVELNPCQNEVIVSTAAHTIARTLVADTCNWISIPPPEIPIETQIKVRSAGEPIPDVTIQPLGNERYEAHFPNGIAGVAPGQSAVFYQGDTVLGGGIIRSTQ